MSKKIIDLEKLAKILSCKNNLTYVAFQTNKADLRTNYYADLVVTGQKQATTSLYGTYQAANEKLPQIGDLMIVKNADNQMVALIRNIKVTVCKYKDVSEEMAELEGEDDKSLKSWRQNHFTFLRNETIKYKLPLFTIDDLVVFEQFELIATPNKIINLNVKE
jgi:uncharacterized protein YhfF